jgi:hypothetical protein
LPALQSQPDSPLLRTSHTSTGQYLIVPSNVRPKLEFMGRPTIIPTTFRAVYST